MKRFRLLLILEIAMLFGTASAKEEPDLIFHLDFNTCVLNRACVLKLLEHVASAGYTAILWEIENSVRFDCAPTLASADAYTRQEFQEILKRAKELGLEPIPLLQTIGHGEYVLDHEEYRHLREQPDEKDCYCPSNPGTVDFLRQLVHEYLEIFGPDVRRFHLGGDEVYSFRTCPDCKPKPAVELYIRHLEAVASELRDKGIRPGVWHDMLRHFDRTGKVFSKLPRDFTLWYWEYFYPKGQDWAAGAEEGVRAEIRRGREVIVCGSIQCHQDDPFLVRYGMHRENLEGTIGVCRREGLSGYCVTSWMCHQGAKELQLPLIDFAAVRYLRPGKSKDSDWEKIIKTYYGDVPIEWLDLLTAWNVDFRYFDGRCWTKFKDGIAPEKDYFSKVWSKRQSGAHQSSSLAHAVSFGVRSAAEKLASLQKTTSGPLTKLALEAAVLKAEYLEMAANNIVGRNYRPIPYTRARAFYSRELRRDSVERAIRRIYQGHESSEVK